MKILVINGPNLNMLGIREKNIYGSDTYSDLLALIEQYCKNKGIEVTFFQSNFEGEIINQIQKAYQKMDGIIINPAAYTHTSIAILDALKAVQIPTVEVHISDISQREDFRKISYVGMYAEKRIIGEGFKGYLMAVDYLEEKYSCK